MSKDGALTPFMALFWMFVDFVQMIGFAFPADVDFSWYVPGTSWISLLTSPLRCVTEFKNGKSLKNLVIRAALL
jgi:hypothetical protein